MSITINNESFTITNNGKSFELLKDDAKLDRDTTKVYMNGFWWDLQKAVADGFTDLDDLYDTLRYEIDHRYSGGGGGVIPLVIIGAATDTYQDNALMGKTILLVSTDNAVRIPTDYAFTSGTGTIVFASSIETNSIIQILYK